MNSVPSFNPAAFAERAAELCNAAVALNREDARLGFKYLLLRLTTVGLAAEEVGLIQKLAVAVFKNADIGSAVQDIREIKSSSPIATAIANVVEAAPANQRQSVLLGAVLSAHAAHNVGERRPALVLFVVVNGAATAQTTILTNELIAHGRALDFAQRD